jgi:ABC-type transporter Mla MlaB component
MCALRPVKVRGESRGAVAADRCPYHRPFTEATPCPAFEPTSFIAANSYGTPLGTHLGCAHLVSGELAQGQFYARCSLGDAVDRLQAVARVGPGTVATRRALIEEFEAIARRYRGRLFAAKSRALRVPLASRVAAQEQLAALATAFLAELRAFVAAHADRVAEAGLTPEAVGRAATQVVEGWVRSRWADPPDSGMERLQRAEAAAPQADRPAAPDPCRAGQYAERVGELVIVRTAGDPPTLSLSGQIDEGSIDGLTAVLEEATGASGAARIDLAGLTFCSVAGMRTLAMAVTRGLRVHGVPSHLVRAVEAAGLPRLGEPLAPSDTSPAMAE